MYVHVTARGAMSFRMDYRLNGRRETIYLGKHGPDGLPTEVLAAIDDAALKA
jgi:hypothetical protein